MHWEIVLMDIHAQYAQQIKYAKEHQGWKHCLKDMSILLRNLQMDIELKRDLENRMQKRNEKEIIIQSREKLIFFFIVNKFSVWLS